LQGRRGYGGLKIDHAKLLKELKRENERLKKAVSELTRDKQILKEALSGKYWARPTSGRAWTTCAQLSVSERRACAVVGQSRSTQRRQSSR
jgi:hypothetical protein